MTSSISFAGCGFLMSYHVGVAMCLRKFAPELVRGKICATSSGLLVAVSLICDIPLGVIMTEILRITNIARSFTLGALDPRFHLERCLEEVLRNHLPEDAHDRATGRLFISLTRIHDKSNVVLSEFRYREHLIRAVLAGCFIPTYSGLLPSPYLGVRYIDGSVTNNQPVIDQNTIRVSPFSGESDICPKTGSGGQANCSHANLMNMVVDVTEENLGRLFRVFIPQDPAAMIRLCEQGFDDALGYLQCNKSAMMVKSFFITSTFHILESEGKEDGATAQSSSTLPNRSGNNGGGRHWEGTVRWRDRAGDEDGEFTDIDSSVLSLSENVLKTLNISGSRGDVRHGAEYNRSGDGKTIRPVDLIAANLKSIAGDSFETRAFQMRLPKYEPPLTSKFSSGHVSAYFKRYLLRPVTQMVSEKICEASRVVLDKVNKRVNVDALTDLLLRRENNHSSPEEIKLLKHILQMTNEQMPFETVYFMEASDRIHVTELFDISDCEDTTLQTETERELNQLLEFDIDDWGDADFGTEDVGYDDNDVDWDVNLPNDFLFPATVGDEEEGVVGDGDEPVDGSSSFIQSKKVQGELYPRRSDVQMAKEAEEEVTAENVVTPTAADVAPLPIDAAFDDHDDPYTLSDMTSKALNMSQEYNEMIFGTFRHFGPVFSDVDGSSDEDEGVQKEVNEVSSGGRRRRSRNINVAPGYSVVIDEEALVEAVPVDQVRNI